MAAKDRMVSFDHPGSVCAVAFSPDGTLLASTCGDNKVYVRDVTTGQLKWTLSGHTYRCERCVFSPDSKQLATASRDQTVRVWDMTTGQFERTLSDHSIEVFGVAWSPDGRVIVSGGYEGAVHVWYAVTAALLHSLPKHPAHVVAVVFSRDGALLATDCSDGQVRLWDARSGSWPLVHQWQAHEDDGYIHGPAFSATAALLATHSHETAQLWDVSDPRKPRLLHTLAGHSDRVRSVAFSCDGTQLATGSTDNTVKLWDVATGQLHRTLTDHSYSANGVAFHPQHRNLLATGSTDKTVKLRLL